MWYTIMSLICECLQLWCFLLNVIRKSSKSKTSLTHVQYLQDLNNSNLNKHGGSGDGAPGGPTSSPPVYRVHRGDLSPRSSPHTSPSTLNWPPFSASPSFPDGPVSPFTGGSGVYLDPYLLTNKSPSELPEGVDPSRREVGAGLWVQPVNYWEYCKWMAKCMYLVVGKSQGSVKSRDVLTEFLTTDSDWSILILNKSITIFLFIEFFPCRQCNSCTACEDYINIKIISCLAAEKLSCSML